MNLQGAESKMKANLRIRTFTMGLIVVISLFAVPLTSQVRKTDRDRRRTPTVYAVEKIGPAVVSINTQQLVRRRSTFSDMFDLGDSERRSRGGRYQNYSLGSGVIIDPKGYVITNDHVVQRADRITVSLADGRELPASLIGSDIQNDIAILKVHTDKPLPAARLGRSNDLLLGETAIAVGNPFGLGGSVTSGIVSAINRTVNFRNKKKFKDFIQTSAVINPGNSGGPLINTNGEVIGINVAIHSRGPGIGFAIPVSRVREVVYNVLDPRITKKAMLGIDIDHRKEGSGAVIRAVDVRGPASRSGLAAGDKIITVNNQPIEDWIDFQTTVQDLRIGENIQLEFLKNGKRRQTSLTLLATPPSPAEKAIFALSGFEFKDVPKEQQALLGDLRGVIVTAVPKDSKAAQFGIHVGDIVYHLAQNSVINKDRAFRILAKFSRRTSLPIHLFRPSEKAHYGGDLPLNH